MSYLSIQRPYRGLLILYTLCSGRISVDTASIWGEYIRIIIIVGTIAINAVDGANSGILMFKIEGNDETLLYNRNSTISISKLI